MVLLDATTLLPLLSDDVPAPPDPKTNQPIERVKERIDYLVAQLEKNKEKIIIPTPVLSEILVRVGKAGPEYLERLSTSAPFRIVPFDTRAAVEVAAMTKRAMDRGDKRDGSDDVWAKIKHDRQIVAIAKIEGVTTIYSDDKHVRTLAVEAKIAVVSIAELPLPPEDTQGELPLDMPDTVESESDS